LKLNLVSTFLLVGLLAIATITDFRNQKIPNVLTYPAMILAFMCHVWSNGLYGMVFCVSGLATGLGLLLFPFLCGVMGAGDVKLMGAAGAMLGPMRTLNAFIFICIAGGLIAVAFALVRRRDWVFKMVGLVSPINGFSTDGSAISIATNSKLKSTGLPYGVAIALGTMTSISFEIMGWTLPL
jgi:prepilin peptidase CpaA